MTLYRENSTEQQARLQANALRVGLDLGQPWGRLGELRLGLSHQRWRLTRELGSLGSPALDQTQIWDESTARLLLTLDQLDYANFPQRGYRVLSEFAVGRRQGNVAEGSSHFGRLELQATAVQTWGLNTVNAHIRLQQSSAPAGVARGRFSLGGFQQLSGYMPGQLSGNHVLLGRLGVYRRLSAPLLFTRGAFVGGTLEAGMAAMDKGDLRPSNLRTGMSLYIGADTGLGPVYLGLAHVPRGSTGVYLFIGRP